MRLAIIALAVSAAAVSTVAVAPLALAAKPSPFATPAPPSGSGLARGDCIRSTEIRNHTFADRNTLLIDVRGKDTYRVTMVGSCLMGAISSDPIITRSPPGAAIICKPIDMDIAVGRDGFVSRCIVDSIVKMSPEEVAALPKKLKP